MDKGRTAARPGCWAAPLLSQPVPWSCHDERALHLFSQSRAQGLVGVALLAELDLELDAALGAGFQAPLAPAQSAGAGCARARGGAAGRCGVLARATAAFSNRAELGARSAAEVEALARQAPERAAAAVARGV
jgi:hypothetical protein